MPEICPETRNNPVSLPDNPKEYFWGMNRPDGIKEFGRFVDEVLNQGGLNYLLSYLKTHDIEYYVVDLTNDGVNELVVDFIAIDVFGCKNEKFEKLLQDFIEANDFEGYEIDEINVVFKGHKKEKNY